MLSCHRFVTNQVRLQLFILAYNLGNFLRRLGLPKAINGEFDVILAMYHDQGHIPIKTFSFEKSVSVALGLPFTRTSVDHGTALDIAGKGVARPDSLIEAIKVAAQLVNMGKL